MNFQPKKPLQTLSDFVKKLESETSTFQTSDAIEIIEYNNFLKQQLTKEMFVGEEKIFIYYCNNARNKSIYYGSLYSLKIACFYTYPMDNCKLFHDFISYCMDNCKTIQDLAELARKEGFEVYIKA